MDLLNTSVLGVLTWVGTVIGVLGLVATYLQARAAQIAASNAETASIAAAHAAENAVTALQSRLGLAEIAHSNSQVESIRSQILAGNFSTARATFSSLKRSVLEVCHILSNANPSDDTLRGEIEVTQRNLKVVDMQTENAISDVSKFKSKAASRALAGISDFLIKRSNELTFPSRKN